MQLAEQLLHAWHPQVCRPASPGLLSCLARWHVGAFQREANEANSTAACLQLIPTTAVLLAEQHKAAA